MTEFAPLQKALGVTFRDTSILLQALRHRSYLNEVESSPESNERLEFLGDALLGFVVTEKLYADFPDFSEGDLTRVRSSLVRTGTLAGIAQSLNLGDHLLLGRGEDESGGRKRPRNLACTLEAIIGALHIDQGLETARDFILRILKENLDQISHQQPEKDPKSTLQEIMQAERHVTPTYRITQTTGPDHQRVFTVEVWAGEHLLGEGCGNNKRAAEQAAAHQALEDHTDKSATTGEGNRV